MNNNPNLSNGVNRLFDVLFHEIMDSHPNVRQSLNQRLATHYRQCNVQQRQALDEALTILCHQSFAECFNAQTH